MTVRMSKANGEVVLRARAASPGIVGTYVEVIGPGWKLFGKTYEEWISLPPGSYEIADGASDGDYCPPELAIAE